MVEIFENRVEENLGEGKLAWEKELKRYAISKSITTLKKKKQKLKG